jgi:transposase
LFKELRLAGLHLAEDSSGKHKGRVKITKRGRPFLRKMLYLAVMTLVANNAEFKALHAYNVKVRKMKRKRSMLKLCGKLARIMVALCKTKAAYVPSTVSLPGTA